MINNIINLIFPPKCIFCGNIVNSCSHIEICENCFKRIPFMSENNQKSFLRSYGYIDKIICVCEYSGIIKDSLIRYKFFEKSGYHRTFAKLLAEKVKKMTNYREFDIIISVPLHNEKEKARGYNQSKLISKIIGRELCLHENSGLLSRIKNTYSQSLLSKEERHFNVHGAFKINRTAEAIGKSILLVDDIMTTGSTLEECAKVLKEAGAKNVTAAIIASGRKF